MPTETQKTVVGLLLVGASMLTGNAVLITVAGGVGVNWTSEGLAGLWGQAGALTERSRCIPLYVLRVTHAPRIKTALTWHIHTRWA